MQYVLDHLDEAYGFVRMVQIFFAGFLEKNLDYDIMMMSNVSNPYGEELVSKRIADVLER